MIKIPYPSTQILNSFFLTSHIARGNKLIKDISKELNLTQ